MNAILTSTRPTSGQFVMVHKFDDKLWGTTFEYRDDFLYEYGEIDTDSGWSLVEDFDTMYGGVEILGYLIEGF